MASRTYIALVEEAEEGGYGVSFPDLPGCVSGGDDMDDAVSNAAEALSLHLNGMVEDGDDLPSSRSLNQVDGDLGKPAGRFVYASVSAEVEDGNERVNVYLPKSLLRQIEAFGDRSGIDNRSTFLRLAARFYLASNEGMTLTTPIDEATMREFIRQTGTGGSARKVGRVILAAHPTPQG